MSSDSVWTPIGQKEIDAHRRNLPKGHIREFNTAHTVGYDHIVEGDDVEITQTPAPTSIAQAAPPREVADDIFGQMYEWATSNPDAYALMVKMMRHNNPKAFGHLSDDELQAKMKEHAESVARQATESVYKQWDTGNDLDQWGGKAAAP